MKSESFRGMVIALIILFSAQFAVAEAATDYASCLRKADDKIDSGDINNFPFAGGMVSVGTAVLAQAIRYDFSSKKSSFNAGVGAGASFRFYRHIEVPKSAIDLKKDVYWVSDFDRGNGTKGEIYKVPVSSIKSDCRASTFKNKDENTLAAPMFSITPAIFASQLEDDNNLRVEPALMVGFFEDIINIGVGFNLSGQDGDVGDVFLLLSAGVGFQF